jgi:ACR3 family arsenite transporter
MALLGKERFQTRFLPYFAPLSLISLLYVIIVIFASQARDILHNLGPVFRVFVPLCLYFFIMWTLTFVGIWRLSRRYGESNWDYQMAVVQSFTGGSNNFELAIAIAVATYGADSKECLGATIGPLVEVPVLLILSYVALWLGARLQWGTPRTQKSDAEAIASTSSKEAK